MTTQSPAPSPISVPLLSARPLDAEPGRGPSDALDAENESDSEALEIRDGQRVYLCRWTNCGQSFPKLDELVKHLHDGHTVSMKKGEFVCGWLNCSRKGVSQASRFALITHLRSHTGEKPYVCTACQKGFKRSDALGKHKQRCAAAQALEATAAKEAGHSVQAPVEGDGKDGSWDRPAESDVAAPDQLVDLLGTFASDYRRRYTLLKYRYRQLKIERRILEDEYAVTRTKLLRLRTINQVALEKLTGKRA